MSKFKVGEIAVTTGLIRDVEKNGQECEIIQIGATCVFGESKDYAIIYKDLPNHRVGHWCIDEKNLRKKKPPQETSTWEEVQEISGWNPSKVVQNEKP